MRWSRSLVAGGLALAGVLLPAADSRAQITFDGSLGAAGPLTGPNFTIGSDRGRTVGNNLFHSFGVFNVHNQESATFNGPSSIANVIGRVTGGQVSTIDGLIDTRSAMPSANFFLLNPNGVMLGPGASLNVGGAFHVSTADYLCLGSGGCLANAAAGKFFASLARESVLTAAPPAAFGFLGPPTGSITVQGSRLPGKPSSGQTISLVGGDIQVTGATLSPTGGRVELVSVASAGEVLLPGLDVSSFSRLGSVTVASTTLDVSGNPGGTVMIRGGRLVIDGTTMTANTGLMDAAPVGIDLASTGSLTISNRSTLGTLASGLGRGGDIRLSAADLQLTSGTVVLTRATATGRGGDIEATASSVLFDGARLTSATLADGAAGDVAIAGGQITLANNSLVSSLNRSTTGARGGNVSLTATDAITVSGSNIQNSTEGSGTGGQVFVSAPSVSLDMGASISSVTLDTGRGGDVTVEAGRLTLRNGSHVSATTSGTAAGGRITVTATDSAFLGDTGTSIATGSFGDPTSIVPGPPGDIAVHAGTLTLTGGSVIQGGVFAGTLGANVSVTATGPIVISNGSGISSEAFSESVGRVSISAPQITMDNGYINTGTLQSGRAGDISIETGTLTLTNGAQIASSSIANATGSGGNIGITATDSVTISGASPTGKSVIPVPYRDFINDASSGLFSTASSANPRAGSGGSINVSTPRLSLADGGKISVATTGAGAAGNVVIDTGTMSVASAARVDSSTSGTGRGGGLTVTAADSVTITGTDAASGPDTGLFSTASSANPRAGGAGSIIVSAPTLSLADGGKISVATTGAGAAGNIAIDAATTSVMGGSRIDSSTSGTGRGGSLTVRAADSAMLTGTDSGLFSTTSSQDPGAGAAGSINVATPRLALDSGGRISVATTGAGAAGNIVIDAATTSVASGARIDSGTSGLGHGGTITVNTANGTLTIDGAALSSDASGTGAGGDVTVAANQISLTGGGTISARSTGTADALAGSINIAFGDSLTMRNGSITTSSDKAPGGNVTISSPSASSLMLLVDSQLTTSVHGGLGGGGNVKIGTNGSPLQFIVLNNGGIHADAFGGPGGNIDIFADVLLSSTPIEGTITASSQLSRPGTINITAVITNLSGVLAELPAETLKASELIRASCAARLAEGKASSLVLAGREGVPLEPIGLLPSTLGEFRPAASGMVPSLSDPPALRLSYLDSKCAR
jgi:filamentous hemagglutinin family protein